jgi:hypothetical protein
MHHSTASSVLANAMQNDPSPLILSLLCCVLCYHMAWYHVRYIKQPSGKYRRKTTS